MLSLCFWRVLCLAIHFNKLTRTAILALDFPQIVPMSDEETDAELKITHTSFADPYVLVLRDDSSVCILHMDTKGELEELDKPEAFTSIKWSSGSLYHAENTNETFAFLLSVEDSVHVSRPVAGYCWRPMLTDS